MEKRWAHYVFTLIVLVWVNYSVNAQTAIDTTTIKDIYSMSVEDIINIKIVSASKFSESIKEIPVTIVVVTKEDIKNRGYISLNEVIHDLPGFDIAAPYSEFTQIQYARGNRTGSYNERTLFMVNGIEHNLLYCQAMNIAEDFPLSSIERIEVLYGPASAVYGPNAFSGIINVITRIPDEVNSDNVYIYSGLGTNSTYYADITYLGKQGDIDLSVSFRKFRSDRFDISDRPGYFADEPGDIQAWGGTPIPVGNGTLIGNRALWGPYADISPKFENIAEDYGLLTKIKYKNFEIGFNNLRTKHGNGSLYPFDKTFPTKYWEFVRYNGFIRLGKEMNDKLNIATLVNFNYDGVAPECIWGEGWNDSNDWNSMRTAEILSWKYLTRKIYIFEDFIFEPVERITINGGFKYANGTYQKSYETEKSHQYYFDPATDFDLVIDTDGTTVMDSLKSLDLYPGIVNSGITPGNSFSDNEYGGFLQLKFSLINNRLFLIGGARYDDNDVYGAAFNPRIGAIFNINKSFLLKGNYGTAYQSTAPRNMYGAWGDYVVSENLDPEEIISIDIGGVYFAENFSVDMTGFYNKVTNTVLQGQNMPDKNIIGTEMKFNALFTDLGPVLNRVQAHVNISLISSKYDSTLTNEDGTRSSDLVEDIAPVKWNAILDADFLNELHLDLRINYVGGRETIISNPIDKIDPYLIVNSSLQWRDIFNTNLTLFININNLLDKEYYHPGWDMATVGEDLSHPSVGWYSSRLPQPGRTFMFGIKADF